MVLVSILPLALLAFSRTVSALTVSVSATASHPIPTSLWGQMYEDISHSGDGGLYAELLQNRAFQQVVPGTPAALNAWEVVNGASLNVIREVIPVSSALPNALQVVLPSGRSGPMGFANTGFYGIKVTSGATYTASFYYRFPKTTSFRGNATISLQSTSGQVFGSTTAALSGAQTAWKQVEVKLRPTKTATSTSNLFVIVLDGATAAGQTVNFAMFSLFPPTYKNRANGMRADLAETLVEMGPTFFRFPGGNNLEGQTVATRWKWNATVGSLIDRPGRPGDWGYVNTDGLGLLDYLNWCEDSGMEPIMGVWAGYALGGETVPENQLGPYIQEAIDQINFAIGDPAKSRAAALRASLGHPAPFALKYIEIGNEDIYAATSYVYRWRSFATALKAQFPHLRYIATSDPAGPALTPKPTEYDVHVYSSPSWFAQNTFFYDDFVRDGTKYFEGEYAANWDGAVFDYPTMKSSSGEAAFMTGLERNSDIVFAASYAPLLNHVANSQWSPNLISFDAGAVYRSTSFYVQKLFSLNKGDAYIPSTLPERSGTLFWSVVRVNKTKEIIIKVSNTVETAAPITFALPFATVATSGTLQVIQGAEKTSNTPAAPNTCLPTTSSIATAKNLTYNAPGFSVSVIRLVAH